MSRRERWAWAALVILLLAAARIPLHRATFHLPVSNDDAIPLLMARGILRGELATILWNQPYNGALDAYLLAPGLALASPHAVFRLYEIACGLALVALTGLLARAAAGERAGWIAAALAAVGTPYMALMAATGPTPNFLVPLLVGVGRLARAAVTDGRRSGHGARRSSSGWSAGLAVWDSFLALPALAGGLGGLLLAGVRPRRATLAWASAGAAAGLAPLLVARAVGASAATRVTEVRPRWLWTSGVHDLVRAARGLFGIDVPLVVDGPERGVLPAAAAVVLAISIVAALVLGATRRRALPAGGMGGRARVRVRVQPPHGGRRDPLPLRRRAAGAGAVRGGHRAPRARAPSARPRRGGDPRRRRPRRALDDGPPRGPGRVARSRARERGVAGPAHRPRRRAPPGGGRAQRVREPAVRGPPGAGGRPRPRGQPGLERAGSRRPAALPRRGRPRPRAGLGPLAAAVAGDAARGRLPRSCWRTRAERSARRRPETW